MRIEYRDAVAQDIPATLNVFRESLGDLAKRFNLTIPMPDPEGFRSPFEHVLKTGIFRVAELDGEVVSHCMAVVRDGLWFLSSFWALPAHQQKKVGQPLLQQVMQAGREQGADTFAVWSTIDPDSVACYIKQGMVPGFQIFVFGGVPIALPPKPDSGSYTIENLRPETAHAIDREVRGTSREVDHAYFMNGAQAGGIARQVSHGGHPVGYYYTNGKIVGPTAWLDDEHGEAVLAAAMRDAAAHPAEEGKAEVRIVVPGINRLAIRMALKCGLRLKVVPHLLTTAPFGKLDRYIISGPTLF